MTELGMNTPGEKLASDKAPARTRNLGGQPRSFINDEQLYAHCQDYFRLWAEQTRPLTVIGLCVFLDVTRETFAKYLRGEYDTDTERYSDTLVKAKEYIENDKLEKTMLGVYKHQIAIFDLINNHGYVNKVEQTVRNAPGEKFNSATIITAQDGIEAFDRLNKMVE